MAPARLSLLTDCCQVPGRKLCCPSRRRRSMDTRQIAWRLVELCRGGEFSRSQEELFAPNAVSREPESMRDGPLGNADGLDAIRRKGKAFEETFVEMHGVTVSDPLVAGDFFSVAMGFDATWKRGGRRTM